MKVYDSVLMAEVSSASADHFLEGNGFWLSSPN